LGDTLQSVAVVVSACLIYWGGEDYKIADPICTLIFSVITVISTKYVFLQSIYILMEKAPLSESDYDKIYNQLKKIEGVKDIHDLHIWSLSS
jgi:cation diffusion facilitator family transporter